MPENSVNQVIGKEEGTGKKPPEALETKHARASAPLGGGQSAQRPWRGSGQLLVRATPHPPDSQERSVLKACEQRCS